MFRYSFYICATVQYMPSSTHVVQSNIIYLLNACSCQLFQGNAKQTSLFTPIHTFHLTFHASQFLILLLLSGIPTFFSLNYPQTQCIHSTIVNPLSIHLLFSINDKNLLRLNIWQHIATDKKHPFSQCDSTILYHFWSHCRMQIYHTLVWVLLPPALLKSSLCINIIFSPGAIPLLNTIASLSVLSISKCSKSFCHIPLPLHTAPYLETDCFWSLPQLKPFAIQRQSILNTACNIVLWGKKKVEPFINGLTGCCLLM